MNISSVSDEELVIRIRKEDKDAEEELFTRYKQIVRSRARPFFLAGSDHEDIIQEGMIGLYKAVCDYDLEKEVSFRAFADICIKRQILTAIKTASRKKHQPLNNYISLSTQAFEGESEKTLIEMLHATDISDPEEMYIIMEDAESIRENMDKMLTPLEKRCLSLYLKGFSYQQIGEMLKKNKKSVDNAIQRVKKKMESVQIK